MKLFRRVYCQWTWQTFSLDPFTSTYYPDNARCIAGFRSNNISFRDVIQSQANRENYDKDFRTSRKWRQHKMQNLEYKLFYYQPQKIKGIYAK